MIDQLEREYRENPLDEAAAHRLIQARVRAGLIPEEFVPKGRDSWDRGDWWQALKYVSGKRHDYGDGHAIDAVPPGADVSVAPFTLADIRQVHAHDIIANQEYADCNPLALLELADGRWAVLEAWSDSSGWG